MNEKKRSLTMPQMPRPGLGATSQTVFSADCSSPNTPDAPNSRTNSPTPMLRKPEPGGAGIFRDRLDGIGGSRSDHTGNFARNVFARGVFAKSQTGHGDSQDDQRGDREQRVVRERSRQTGHVVLVPSRPRLFQNLPNRVVLERLHRAEFVQIPCTSAVTQIASFNAGFRDSADRAGSAAAPGPGRALR